MLNLLRTWTEERCKIREKGMMSGNSKKAYNSLKALTKTQQCKSIVIKDNSGNILTESTAVWNWWTEYCSGLYKYELHPDTPCSRVTRSPHKSLKAYQYWRKRLKRLCAVWKQESLQEWTTFPSELLKTGGEVTETGKSPGVDNISLSDA